MYKTRQLNAIEDALIEQYQKLAISAQRSSLKNLAVNTKIQLINNMLQSTDASNPEHLLAISALLAAQGKQYKKLQSAPLTLEFFETIKLKIRADLQKSLEANNG